ncbi:MAG: hypothetical protein DWQ35_16095 [Planctomycetota bacterium]|nr:MAG: hypothetical protein DWQ35_16095 [Planctomycetota bacterium]REK18245.1 MAG: hypothetical protein DWQ42_20415 [Planctomycetota bacterium]REK49115.1 MAG: hypothetical protein DWQ46_01015 [Planctomycetota bacterium]
MADFHLKRGDGLHQRPLDDVSMASRLVESLVQDTWPSPATIVDFGIDTDRHLGALQHAVHQGCAIYDLDRVMGDGPAITQLVRAFAHYPYGRIEFRTAYDEVADLY